MQFTPVIPPYPSPQGGSSPGHPPVIPMFSPNHPPTTPAWAQPHQFPTHSPYAGTQPTVPGSYFIPPIQLPPQQAPNTPVAPVGSGGFSADWTGYPSSGASPFVHPTASPPALHPRTPYVAAVPPGTAYTMFQQPLPGGFGPSPGQGPPMWMPMHAYTPFAMPGVMPGVWPSTPYPPAAPGGLPPQAPQPAQQQAPAPAPAPPVLRLQDVVELSKIDKFAEGPHYGPVLDPLLIKKVKAKVEINPLLLPPPDNLSRPFLKWNMLFSTAQCQRSIDRPHQSWYSGRQAPATWPRVTSLRLISRSIPWPVEVNAADALIGVTCGEVIEAIHAYMYARVTQKQHDTASDAQKRIISEAFYHNRSTAYGVPGGRLPRTLLRCDWIGQDTVFGGIVADDRLVKEMCGAALPCVFELRCARRYPMTEAEIQENEEREAAAEAYTRRERRSRATSRAPSRPPSRAPSRASSRHPNEDEDEEDTM
ncbi:hypothetical protein AcV5_005595 [Taiwanofungus camphoratus]|nr:hypothetical protein AcV5_005595 [Antrodia cinnamomea]